MPSESFSAWLQHFLPKHRLTWFSGILANVKNPLIKNYLITTFIKKYKVNMQEALEPNPLSYLSFNEFFIRKLQEELRPIASAPIVSPVDGVVSELGSITDNLLLQAKGSSYSVQDLLVDSLLSQEFNKGKFATFYLSPKDYHRIHMPLNGKLRSMYFIPGKLFSVQPSTVKAIPRLFARNERLVVFFDTDLGLMAMVLVGAVIVGAIGTSWQGDIQRTKNIQKFDCLNLAPLELQQGEEMGYFKLGSTVVLLFANGEKVSWADSLKPGLEIKYGEAIGT